jgi:hypothetical protein
MSAFHAQSSQSAAVKAAASGPAVSRCRLRSAWFLGGAGKSRRLLWLRGRPDALHDVHGRGGDWDGSLGDGGVGSGDGRNCDRAHSDGADEENEADKPFRERGRRDRGESDRGEKSDESSSVADAAGAEALGDRAHPGIGAKSSEAAGGKQEPDPRGREMQNGQKVQGNQHLASEVEAIDEELRGGGGAEGWIVKELEIKEGCGATADRVAGEDGQ